MPTGAPRPALQELADVRQAIDAMDERIVGLLAQRFDLTHRVGQLKAQTGQAPLSAARQDRQRRLWRALAARHVVDEQMLLDVFAVVQAEVLRRHARIAQDAGLPPAAPHM